MTLNAACGQLSTTTGAIGTTIVVSGLGFQPKVVFLWWNGRTDTVDATGRRTHQRGFGVAISTTDRRNVTTLSQDTPTAMVTNKSQGVSWCVVLTTTADAIDGELDVQSIDSGGFTLVVDDVFTASYTVGYLALGGSDISNVIGGALTAITTTGTQDVTGLGFDPNFVFFLANYGTNNSNTITLDSNLTLGVATGSGAGNQAVYQGASNDAAANAQTISYGFDAEILAFPNSTVSAATLETRAEFTSWLTGGFRINWLENVATARIINYVAIKFADPAMVKVFNLLTQTDTTTAIPVTMGFTPVGGLLVSHCKAKSTQDAPQDDDQWSCGAFVSTSSRLAFSVADDDAAGTAVVTSGVEFDECYQNLDPTGGVTQGLMDVQSIDTDTGATFIMDDADPAQAFVWGFAIGTPPVSVGQPTMARWQGVPHMALPTARLGHARR